MKISPRLQAIADWIERGAKLADIGTDHGLLPIYCVLNGITERVVASDIRELPLQAARRNAALYGIEDRITFSISSGLELLKEGSVDTVVAAGMGGETIIEILSSAEWIRRTDMTFLLQPQSKLTELQNWLGDNGFYADKAKLVRDGGRIYLILRVHWDGVCRQTDPFFLSLLEQDELLDEYASKQMIRIKKQLLAFRETEDSEEKNRLLDVYWSLRQVASGERRNNDDGK